MFVANYLATATGKFVKKIGDVFSAAAVFQWDGLVKLDSPGVGRFRISHPTNSNIGEISVAFGGGSPSGILLGANTYGNTSIVAGTNSTAKIWASDYGTAPSVGAAATSGLASTGVWTSGVAYQDSVPTVTCAASATTFAVTRNVNKIAGDAGGNTIATITGGRAGAVHTLIFLDANVTITDDATGNAGTINLSAAFTSAANTVLQLVSDGASWREVCRSVNG